MPRVVEAARIARISGFNAFNGGLIAELKAATQRRAAKRRELGLTLLE